MRVHISLDPDKVSDAEARKSALDAIESKVPLANVNRKRAERFGVITADVDPEFFDIIRAFDYVSTCEPDAQQKAI